MSEVRYIELDGDNLSPEDLVLLSTGSVKLRISPEAEIRVEASRKVIEEILQSNRVVYGINTGFGSFSNVVIARDKLAELQRNLIISHSSGVGAPLSIPRTRMLLALRANILCKGHSGIRLQTLRQIIDAFNANCLSVVPEQGTVGASGDLAPLSHLALGLMGMGEMWDPEGKKRSAATVLSENGLTPIQLEAKEGLAMINGTQLITALAAEALVRAENIAKQADIVTALTLEALKGTVRAMHPRIHDARPHKGQGEAAGRMRAVLHSNQHRSEIAHSHFNCSRVHGVTHDTLRFVRGIIQTEMNSATDNPMVFLGPEDGEDGDEATLVSPPPIDSFPFSPSGFTLSGGNFHGEYPAKACDYLAIAISEIANISERRIERLCNPQLSGLPAFLVPAGGLNSGFMIAHCTAAALVSENKVLCHPASIDSISTSAAKEDHVSMGGWAARKALKVVEHVETVVAIELLAACQGIDLQRPLKTTRPLEEVIGVVREKIPFWDCDRYMAPDIQAALLLLQRGEIMKAVQRHVTC